MAHQYTLYGRQASGSLAVQVALEEAGVQYDRIWVSKEPTDVEQLKRVNVTGKVPALKLPDGTVMIESAAMLIYLAQQFPGKIGPTPQSKGYAPFLQWMVFLTANVYESALRMYYPARYSSRGEADAEAVQTQAAQDFTAHLKFISQTLSPYLLGAEYSIADAYLYMLATWHRGDIEALYRDIPALGKLASLVKRRPAVAKVEADHGQ
jgi:glutathione S-transferase